MEQIDKLQSQILEHKASLYDTDYVIIRGQEMGQGIPENVKYMRTFARAEINRLEYEIAELEKQFTDQSEDVQLWAELNPNHKRNVEAQQ